MSRYLAAHQGYHLSNDLVYINQLPLRSTLLEQQAGSADNFRGTGCVFDHSRRRFARLFHIGMIAVEPAQAGVGVGDRRQHLLALARSEEHTSELQSQSNLVCRLLLEKKKISTMQRLRRT